MRRRDFITGASALATYAALPKDAAAITRDQRATLLGGVSKYAGSTYQRSYVTNNMVIAGTTEFAFPSRIAPTEPGRTQLIVKNTSSIVFDLGYNTTDTNNTAYSATSFTITLNPGQEYVENGFVASGAIPRILMARPHVSGQLGKLQVFKEMNGAVQSGTAVIRAITPLPMSPLVLSAVAYNQTTVVCGISRNKATVYGTAGTAVLSQSVDDGANWTAVHTFTGNVVTGAIETDDGEMLVFCNLTGGVLFKSSGWAASHTSATWSQVAASATGGAFRNFWGGGNQFGKSGPLHFISEYGKYWSTTPTPDATATTHVYMSQDYGATWTLIFDGQVQFPSSTSFSTYGVAYDPYEDRVYVVCGNTGPFSTNHIETVYSDDWRNGASATWTQLPIATQWNGSGNNWQAVTLAITKSMVMLGSEGSSGVFSFPKTGPKQLGNPFVGMVVAAHSGSQSIAAMFNRNAFGDRFMFGTSNAGGGNDNGAIIFLDQLDDGKTLQQAWNDDSYETTFFGVWQLFGPTANGVFLAAMGGSGATGAGTPKMLRASLVSPAVGTYDQTVSLTGDGATKIFTFPHFLGITPTILNAYPQNQVAIAAVPTLTADGTNITLTFAAAPTNATLYTYALRYQ